TAEMVPLSGLTTGQLATVAAAVPGGAANIADVYPLAPLQEGLLFHHHLDNGDGRDPYLLPLALRFDNRALLDDFLRAWQRVIDRHDILRTAVIADGLPHPVQVVHRTATLPIVEVGPGAALSGEAAVAWLLERADRPMDLRRAPLLDAHVMAEPGADGWLLVLRSHHIVLDHTTLDVVLAEVAAIVDGREAELPEPLPYREFVGQALLGVPAAEHERYFTDRLGTVTEPTAAYGVLEVRGDGSGVREVRSDLPDDVGAALREQARRYGVSPATVFHVIWSRVLAAVSGRTDVTFGTVLFGRMRGGTGSDRVPGLFINTLPVRAGAGTDGVLDAVRSMGEQLADLIVHEHASLALAQRCSGVTAPTPLFTSVLNYRFGGPSTDGREEQEPPAAGGRLLWGQERTNYPLLVSVDDVGAGFSFVVQAVAPIDPDSVIGLLHSTTRGVLTALAENPRAALGQVAVLPGEDREQLIAERNDTGRALPAVSPLALFDHWATTTPDAVAVVTGGPDVTYRELAARSRLTATALAARGAGAGSRVAVVADASADVLAWMLGALRVGAAYLLVETGTSAAGLADLVAASGVDLVVAGGALEPGVDVPDDRPAAVVTGATAAYLLWDRDARSAVVVSHESAVNQATWFGGGPGPADERVLVQAPTGSARFAAEVWPALTTGAALVLARPGGHRDPGHVAMLVERQRVSTAWFTPAGLAAFVAACPPERRRSLRRVFTDAPVADPGVPVTVTSGFPATSGAVLADRRPVANVRVYVLDEGLQPVPAGATGELYVAGTSVSQGYAGQPAATGHRFVADPFTAAGRLYRTGLRARWTGDGRIEYVTTATAPQALGPAALRALLSGHPDVTTAAVVAGEGRLTAYVVPAGDLAEEELSAWVAARWPVPVELVVLTGTGDADAGDVAAALGGRAPSTRRESLLCEAFAEILGLPRVGPDDNFFELGGHSLLATRLVSLLRTRLDAEIPLRAVFETPTAAGLARHVEAARAARRAITAGPRPERVPLSFAQRRLWFLSRLEGPNATYNIPFVTRLRGRLDLGSLRGALGDVLDRHESLRTVIGTADGRPYLRILKAAEARPELPVVPVEPGTIREHVASAVAYPFDLEADLPLRVTFFPVGEDDGVLVLVLHHLAGDGGSLEALWRDLSTAYAARTRGGVPGWAPLPVQYADYALWQHELLGDDEDPGSPLNSQLEHWREALDGAPPEIALPVDRPRQAVAGHEGAAVAIEIGAETHTRVYAVARDHQATAFMVVEAALAVLLARLGAGDDVLVGTPVSGRTDAALDDVVGFFVNTLVLRNDVSGDPAFGEVLRRTRESALGAFDHQDVPFERLVEELAPERSLARHPLFQVMMTMRGAAGDRPFELGGLRAEPLDGGLAAAKFDLEFSFVEQFTSDGVPDGMTGSVVYAAELFDESSVRGLVDRFVRLLGAAVADPGVRVSRLPVLDESEVGRLEEWGGGAVAAVPESVLGSVSDSVPAVVSDSVPVSVLGLFAGWVARTPDAVAVVFEGTVVSYGELDAWSSRVAAGLVARGAGAEVPVAVVLPRSVELIVVLLAVWKSGAAFVPVDPDYPAERIAAIIADSGARLVVDSSDLPGLVGDSAGVPGVGVDSAGVSGVGGPLPGQAAYVMFTSGSTGRPKGVVVSHGGVGSLLS
ncbi:condensation domain-containing protein, partial [Actinacidiphila acididurans]